MSNLAPGVRQSDIDDPAPRDGWRDHEERDAGDIEVERIERERGNERDADA